MRALQHPEIIRRLTEMETAVLRDGHAAQIAVTFHYPSGQGISEGRRPIVRIVGPSVDVEFDAGGLTSAAKRT
jgi:hypothetical protein